jgi:alpha-1,6-mannosyltransferase
MRHRTILALWGVVAAALGLAAAVFVAFRGRFDYAFELIDIPAIPLAIGLCLAGLLVLPLPWLIRHSDRLEGATAKQLLVFVLAVGFALRCAMFVTQPALEDDYYRYLWDGAVTAHGMNPYAESPAAALEEGDETALGRLALSAGVVMERINHPDLKTIYPPVAQAAFAMAHVIAPWSIAAWRLVCLGGEVATVALILALLGMAARSPLWVALYWWNPLVVKEMINSTHMEAILMPLVLAAILLAARRRPLLATGTLGLAIGAKLWPVLLAPLILRPLLARPKVLITALLLLTLMIGAWALPPWLGEIDETSGFVAFANRWQTNSASFLVVSKLAATAMQVLQLSTEQSGLAARAALGLGVAGAAIWTAWQPWTDAAHLMRKACFVTAVLFLLSPAQFPWYATWLIPFLVFCPVLPLLALSALLPIYYVSFHYLAREQYDTFRYGLVWLIWLPVWAGLAIEQWRARTGLPQELRNA